jgi:hypothetical protein
MHWRGRGEWLRGGGRAGGSGKQRRGGGVSRNWGRKSGLVFGSAVFISFSFFKLGDSKHDTDSEPVFRTRFCKPGGGLGGRTECSKVAVTWQWANHLQATVPPGKRLLFMNLGETYVQYYQGLFKGNLAVTKKHWPAT